MSASRPCVVVTSRSFSSGRRDLVGELEAFGLDVRRAAPSHEFRELDDILHDAVAWIAGTGPVNDAHFAAAPNLKVLARYGVGIDAVDLAAASSRKVIVTNTPGANSESVAEHALGLALALIRRILPGDRAVRHGDWAGSRGRELGSMTVGVVGMGKIGQALVRHLSAFGCTILAHDPYVAPSAIETLGARATTLAQLAEEAQLVSLHAPGGAVVIDETWLRLVRQQIVVINTARADLVDEDAIAQALRSGVLAGYGADTLRVEKGCASPLLADDLIDLVVVTPHVAAQTIEAIDRMGSMAVADVLAVLQDREPAFAINRTSTAKERVNER